MKLKTKTAALIAQKQGNYVQVKERVNNLREKPINIVSQFNDITPQKLDHLKYYQTLEIAIPPEKSIPTNNILCNSQSTSKKCPQCYNLQRQNYRLIESNYNLLARHASIIEFIRKDLLKTIFMICKQQYHYVEAVKTIYDILEKIRKFNGRQIVKSEIENCESEDDEVIKNIPQFQKISSKVQSYNFLDKAKLYQPNNFPQLSLCHQIISEQYRPEIVKKQKNDDENLSPRFRHSILDNYKQLLWCEDSLQVSSMRQQSMQEVPSHHFEMGSRSQYSFKQRPFSEKNIKFYRQKKPFQVETADANQNQDICRMLLTQASLLEATLIGPQF